MNALAKLIAQYPNLLLVFVWPWLAKPMLLPYVGGLPSAKFICEKLVASFSNLPTGAISLSTQVPEEAFALTIQILLAENGVNLTPQQLAPLLVGIGNRGLADAEINPPVTP